MALCEICGIREARNECISCHRTVCGDCIITIAGVCVKCSKSDVSDLVTDLKNTKALQFGKFTLASGKESEYYIDIKRAITETRVLVKIAEKISPHATGADRIAGVELGAVPIAVAVALKVDRPFVIVRKERKEHGTGKIFEGELVKGDRVLFVEDVTTTANSLKKAILELRAEGALIEKAVVVVDREEGGQENLGEIGVELIPLVRSTDLLG
ncbi:MAG: orotate phosphoribosyltransferase [Thermoplasmata archaeon]|nr:orotate phosphoribosyltransferase [Thermoplasmata archaeon]